MKKYLVDYFGKPIKKSDTCPENILNRFKVPIHQLLAYEFPNLLRKEKITYDNVIEIQKWSGTKKEKFIYITRVKNEWYRLATKQEVSVFILPEEKEKKSREKPLLIEETGKKNDNSRKGKTIKDRKPKNQSDRDGKNPRGVKSKSKSDISKRKIAD